MLFGAYFGEAIVGGAIDTGANVAGVIMGGAIVAGANVGGANVPGANVAEHLSHFSEQLSAEHMSCHLKEAARKYILMNIHKIDVIAGKLVFS